MYCIYLYIYMHIYIYRFSLIYLYIFAKKCFGAKKYFNMKIPYHTTARMVIRCGILRLTENNLDCIAGPASLQNRKN